MQQGKVHYNGGAAAESSSITIIIIARAQQRKVHYNGGAAAGSSSITIIIIARAELYYYDGRYPTLSTVRRAAYAVVFGQGSISKKYIRSRDQHDFLFLAKGNDYRVMKNI